MIRNPRLVYGVPVATVKKLSKRALFLQRLLLILGVNSRTLARALKLSTTTVRSWRQREELMPHDVHRVLIEAYFDYTDHPSQTWATFAAALNRRAQAARLPGFSEPRA